MTRPLFLEDAYLRDAPARVVSLTPEGGLVLDQALFYGQGGGQPGDSGRLDWSGGSVPIATTIKGDAGALVLIPSEAVPLPPVGTEVTQHLDWERRYRHMRLHTALHLLSVVIPLPVTGGAITTEKARLDFDMPEASIDREGLEEELNALIDDDLPVSTDWITDAELEANPGLVKTMSVAPPRGAGQVRLVRIGDGAMPVDLQPCGGTHVARTAEIGRIVLGKIEKKGRQNRRVNISLDN
ncbi:alanyl-tRNA editing protein [Mesobacterium pallidum]|uniref:alanyl-tRNA editing protein n=1 Tax=Mesobacterium pallidum TaxID=2872037 RepID=UPI001EE1C1C7|nr:alanyl-tRNA editing protein [Mesobacterium pallidum]